MVVKMMVVDDGGDVSVNIIMVDGGQDDGC